MGKNARDVCVLRVWLSVLLTVLPALFSPHAAHAAGLAYVGQATSQGQESQAGVEAVRGAALDLNTASAGELRALPGMGDVYVRRIIEGRPYSAKNQLVTRGVLPREAYERIRDRIVAHRLSRP